MSSLGDLDPRFRPWAQELVALAERLQLRPRVTSTRRSLRAQTALWERWQKVLRGELPPSAQPYPVATPGTSSHQLGLAIDVVVQPAGGQQVLGDAWRGWGGKWWPSDPIHYEAGPPMLLRDPKVVTRALPGDRVEYTPPRKAPGVGRGAGRITPGSLGVAPAVGGRRCTC